MRAFGWINDNGEVVMKISTVVDEWIEVDCPACGIDYDLAIGETRCPCGEVLSQYVLSSGNHYQQLDDGTIRIVSSE